MNEEKEGRGQRVELVSDSKGQSHLVASVPFCHKLVIFRFNRSMTRVIVVNDPTNTYTWPVNRYLPIGQHFIVRA